MGIKTWTFIGGKAQFKQLLYIDTNFKIKQSTSYQGLGELSFFTIYLIFGKPHSNFCEKRTRGSIYSKSFYRWGNREHNLIWKSEIILCKCLTF